MDAGGSFAQLLRSALGQSSVLRLSFDLGREESQAVALILIEASDDELHASRRGSAKGVTIENYNSPPA